MYFVSGRSLNSSRETEFGASRSLADFYQRREQHCSRPAAFKNATVRERPVGASQVSPISDTRLARSRSVTWSMEAPHNRTSTGHHRPVSTFHLEEICAVPSLREILQSARTSCATYRARWQQARHP